MALVNGKVVIVTGGGSEIGEAACPLYAREVMISAAVENGGSLAR